VYGHIDQACTGQLADQADAGAASPPWGQAMNVPGFTHGAANADQRNELADRRDGVVARRATIADQQEIDVELRQMWQAGGDNGTTT
jgi:hypothetical protein